MPIWISQLKITSNPVLDFDPSGIDGLKAAGQPRRNLNRLTQSVPVLAVDFDGLHFHVTGPYPFIVRDDSINLVLPI